MKRSDIYSASKMSEQTLNIYIYIYIKRSIYNEMNYIVLMFIIDRLYYYRLIVLFY